MKVVSMTRVDGIWIFFKKEDEYGHIIIKWIIILDGYGQRQVSLQKEIWILI